MSKEEFLKKLKGYLPNTIEQIIVDKDLLIIISGGDSVYELNTEDFDGIL